MNTISLLFTILKIAIVVGFLATVAAILTWADRRQSAMMQDRVGPNRAEITVFGFKIRLAGLLHTAADGVKFFFKEDFVPPNADKMLHALAPMLSLFPPLVVLGVVPFSDTLCLQELRVAGPDHAWIWQLGQAVPRFGVCASSVPVGQYPAISMQIVDVNVGVLFIFALTGMGIVGATIAGWSSDNKFSLLGGLRAASQLVSYEVAMGLSLVGCMMIYGTIRLDEMARWQGEHVWGVFVQPIAFVLFFAAATAESKRLPFDLPEGESEIVAGYLLEYSGMKFGMFYFGEYMEVVTSSAFLVAIFLGGYNLPFLHRDGITIAVGDAMLWQRQLPHLLIILMQVGAFFSKVLFVCWFQLFVRWSLPRFRYDQLMKLGWRMLLPAALANIFLTGVIVLAIDRAGGDFLDRLSSIGDGVNLLLAMVMIFAFLALVWGFFSHTPRPIRPHAVARKTARAPAT